MKHIKTLIYETVLITVIILSVLPAVAQQNPVTTPTGSSADSARYFEVVITDFRVAATTDGIQLNWSTILEANLASWEIERSQGDGRFVTVEKVKPKGTGSFAMHYKFTDKTPLNGRNIYRLRMTSVRQVVKQSPLLIINWGVETLSLPGITTHPNPVAAGQTLQVQMPFNGQASIRLISLAGHVNYQFNVSDSKSPKVQIQVPPQLPSGIYMLQVLDLVNGKQHQQKIMIR